MNLHFGDETLPEIDPPCCMGAAVHGAHACTCWQHVYDQPQVEPAQEGPMALRAKACADCAFRPGSPEQSGDTAFAHSGDGELDEVVADPRGFACHQGMRRELRVVHPSGAVVERCSGAYRPGGAIIPTKADGTPAELCAGWWAARQKLLAECAAAIEENPSR